jgi:hypothetical protein
MFALLGILALALVVGKVARRITPAVELVLLLLIAVIVLGEFVSWPEQQAGGAAEVIRRLLPGTR